MKIYVNGNYIVVETDDGAILQDAKANVIVCPSNATTLDSTPYSVSSRRLGLLTMTPEETLDVNDQAYSSGSWIAFYTVNTAG